MVLIDIDDAIFFEVHQGAGHTFTGNTDQFGDLIPGKRQLKTIILIDLLSKVQDHAGNPPWCLFMALDGKPLIVQQFIARNIGNDLKGEAAVLVDQAFERIYIDETVPWSVPVRLRSNC